jgi:uncharacterized protein YecE (DUF72 family)
MRILAGTSGYAFKEWKGAFYPEDMPDSGMLAFYAGKFPTVEINNTFYQLPKEKVLLDWAASVPSDFTFSIKASRRITHFQRLKPESLELVDYLLKTTSVLGERLGPILFQLPPNMKKEMDRLRPFLERLPRDQRFAIEFRHESWFDDEVVDALRAHDVALCAIEQEDFRSPVTSTASWGYVRLHRLDYDPAMIAAWAQRVNGNGWTDAYVYFKHDEGAGSGPPAVAAFVKACEH